MGEVTRLSEEGLSLPSLDLGEERVNENSRESSEIELRVCEGGERGKNELGSYQIKKHFLDNAPSSFFIIFIIFIFIL